jgi:hypothetical protein
MAFYEGCLGDAAQRVMPRTRRSHRDQARVYYDCEVHRVKQARSENL